MIHGQLEACRTSQPPSSRTTPTRLHFWLAGQSWLSSSRRRVAFRIPGSGSQSQLRLLVWRQVFRQVEWPGWAWTGFNLLKVYVFKLFGSWPTSTNESSSKHLIPPRTVWEGRNRFMIIQYTDTETVFEAIWYNTVKSKDIIILIFDIDIDWS